MTKIWIKVNDLSSGPYSVKKNIRCITSILGSHLYGYSDTIIVVKGTITVERDNNAKKKEE